MNIAWLTQKNRDQTVQSVLQVQIFRGKLSRDKFKAKSPNFYCNRFHIECYNFYQQYEDNFATFEVIKSN